MGLLTVLTPHFCVIQYSKYMTKSPLCYHTKGDKQKERRLRIPCSTMLRFRRNRKMRTVHQLSICLNSQSPKQPNNQTTKLPQEHGLSHPNASLMTNPASVNPKMAVI